ncbi:YraN family protein [Aestuariicella hydrocarbonica]|uniref:UPF0102 protein G8770_05840 n=1 Tax=Pseudomaricurvus hydrocarbonicus TaxID=1470433 RepID=A0A9E5MGS1_9GAMM|nr:YraN family protein [Aestuariicella hydrocarbonica]NHO65061.1 YraN family protein [Aestuariicella hydrocarbonica]
MLKKTLQRFKKQAGETPETASQKTPKSPESQTRKEGDLREKQAEQFLTTRGLKLVARNYLCKLGEIDLIMRDRDHLVFVEVRYRKSTRFGSASETVDFRKQQKLIRTAQYYLQSHPQLGTPPCRFDVVAIQGTPATSGKPTQPPTSAPQYSSTNIAQKPIEWIANAFTAD